MLQISIAVSFTRSKRSASIVNIWESKDLRTHTRVCVCVCAHSHMGISKSVEMNREASLFLQIISLCQMLQTSQIKAKITTPKAKMPVVEKVETMMEMESCFGKPDDQGLLGSNQQCSPAGTHGEQEAEGFFTAICFLFEDPHTCRWTTDQQAHEAALRGERRWEVPG